MAKRPFEDAVAMVTGGASGIGKALCEELGRRHARVVVTDLQEEGARAVAEGIVKAGGRATSAVLDVRDAAAFERLLDDTLAAHGRLDYLFNNAGLAAVGEAQSLPLDVWRRVLDVNLWGVIHGATAAYARMVRQGSGHIVNIASLAGLAGAALSSPYSASKFGVVGLSLTLRAEGADLGVKVSAVCPAYIKSAIFDNSTYVDATQEGLRALIPFKFLEVDVAVRKLLQGVERNRPIIVFPFYARLLWWLTRLRPQIGVDVNRKTARAFRRRKAKTAPS
ncbi:MAG TPA: SDR family oxidoreductase [Thermoanaerobaculia bacterium]|jgi:NAD(P)-dependent dehydrogenase (short-subunit alcohol dehydrogenase family)|nr:SDR family oxidoreductase [Thermoanaerobaculia bacterium]